jgi:hypothetical protein
MRGRGGEWERDLTPLSILLYFLISTLHSKHIQPPTATDERKSIGIYPYLILSYLPTLLLHQESLPFPSFTPIPLSPVLLYSSPLFEQALLFSPLLYPSRPQIAMYRTL